MKRTHNIMKSTFLTSLTLLLFLSFNIKAQSDTKAQNLISEVLSKVKSYDNIQVEFSYILENTQEKLKQETRGSLSLKNEKYLLNLMGTTQLFDGEKIYTIIPEDEEITISSYNPENDNQLTPSKMLTFFEEGYIYKNDILQNKDGRKIQYIKLIAKDSEADMQEALIGIDQMTKHIYNLIQSQDNGTRIEIRVTKFKPNQPLSSNMFSFDESRYPDYYINNLD
ncbi:LolA family protein [Psychroflexus sp. ALD_RP9]|uniref:LolA family protein n=1 Tax=Psychroflexus sp. ALD_RP9 TaxID=2777186 RepID=UPI001F5D13FB|nr:outer membrane lipoprotein carrier protein LolA [Psychroflexus sp. ALD_RP9]